MGDSTHPPDWREWRRLRALELHQQGWTQRGIAAALGAAEETVSRWLAAARRGGREALASHLDRRGVAPKLAPEQVGLIPDFLWHGAEAYGFRGDVWTCGRVAGVIREEFDVSYSKKQISRLLKHLGWTPQVPITHAIQRDEEAITRWRAESWPALKRRARRERRKLVFVDESGFYLLPGVAKTYAPRARTPVLSEWQTRDHLSVMGGLTQAGKVYTLVRPTSLNGVRSANSTEPEARSHDRGRRCNFGERATRPAERHLRRTGVQRWSVRLGAHAANGPQSQWDLSAGLDP